jgi:mannose-6-phosphate isomerase-like protein (cupin superfamily)
MSKFRKPAVTALAVLAVFLLWHARTTAQENASAGIITVFDHAKLDASFARALDHEGSDVIWGHASNGATYNVSAHSREGTKAPCKPEGCSHKDYTAIVYVVSGSATIMVGGTAKAAPDKFGGEPVQGGESHKLTKGDLYLVPPDTPHWYKDVEGPFRYIEVPIH